MYNSARPFISENKVTIQVIKVYKKASVSSKQSTEYTISKPLLLYISLKNEAVFI